MYKLVHPKFKIILLFINIYFIFTIQDLTNYLYILLFSVLLCFIYRINIINNLKYTSFGVFLSLFNFLFSYISSGNLLFSFMHSSRILLIFLNIYLVSLHFKTTSTNREVSFAVSWVLNIFRPLGYNQNKMYTMILVILNTSYQNYSKVFKMYHYESSFNNDKSFKKVLNLLAPFINNILLLNESITLGLLNKGYKLENKKVKFIFSNKFNLVPYLLLIIFEIIYIVLSKL